MTTGVKAAPGLEWSYHTFIHVSQECCNKGTLPYRLLSKKDETEQCLRYAVDIGVLVRSPNTTSSLFVYFACVTVLL